ncbi:hypothetical protein [Pseudofrankia sp. DC12]|uniref:hypothetical protein n=1 Tax=Pseudofrankia sp. DC12 TaxID=683315 RepID=UPI0005F85239|nr:hypothetical protein [Pseudofrankia sp. DC12]
MTDNAETIAVEAVVALAAGGDERAPGGAVTQALCGHLVPGQDQAWEHAGPCRWPHRTTASRADDRLTVRVVAVSPSTERIHVSRLIADALACGELVGPDGLSQWTLLRSGPVEPRTDELSLARRLAAPPA